MLSVCLIKITFISQLNAPYTVWWFFRFLLKDLYFFIYLFFGVGWGGIQRFCGHLTGITMKNNQQNILSCNFLFFAELQYYIKSLSTCLTLTGCLAKWCVCHWVSHFLWCGSFLEVHHAPLVVIRLIFKRRVKDHVIIFDKYLNPQSPFDSNPKTHFYRWEFLENLSTKHPQHKMTIQSRTLCNQHRSCRVQSTGS